MTVPLALWERLTRGERVIAADAEAVLDGAGLTVAVVVPDAVRVGTPLLVAELVAEEDGVALVVVEYKEDAVLVLELLAEALGERVAVVVLETVVLELAVFVRGGVAEPCEVADEVFEGAGVGVAARLALTLIDGCDVTVITAVGNDDRVAVLVRVEDRDAVAVNVGRIASITRFLPCWTASSEPPRPRTLIQANPIINRRIPYSG